MEKSGTRDKSTSRRRQLIVETAIKCFAEKGFHQTSMRDLAKSAGISLGNVYNHFDSKTALVKEIANLEAQEFLEFQAVLEKNKDPVKALDRFLKIYLEACSEPDYALLAAEILSEGLRNPEVRSGFLNNRSLLASALARVIQEIGEEKGLVLIPAAEDCAELVLDIVEGYSIRQAFSGKAKTKKDEASIKAGVYRLIGLKG
ncbi:TetR/AcrR family transcriptional regulator [Kiloniella laminariae]|uniref:TetR/AcrR family transcriptional regulator n=1 Tax=Kiloniella laminariae TaxID=454162 RepID=A0ABT4LHW5_9PROT|nr:TetR/AcrR family transcriptional regulator [Kiloniella laminariae]MCZ4280689.1 TetR/AcrR family transcriptional regulator [Kiloniella laminariae]